MWKKTQEKQQGDMNTVVLVTAMAQSRQAKAV